MSRLELTHDTARRVRLWSLAVALAAMMLTSTPTRAAIDGITGPNFSLTASADYISMPDGASIYAWGYGIGGLMQLPGPTLIVTAGQTVTVQLRNNLPAAAGNVSILFPGFQVVASGGVPGLLTREARPGGTVTYVFVASQPGTYLYHSGTRPDMQVEMGLYGALIVRPSGSSFANCAYANAATCFDREYLFLLSELDFNFHRAVESAASGLGPITVPTEPYLPVYWMINGRGAPDTMGMSGTSQLPHQPYNCMPRMHPGERILLRVLGAGRQMHPFHTHGNFLQVLARDARLLVSPTDATKLAGPVLFTIPSIPGETVDAIFQWTGKDLGWDIYGHTAANDPPCRDANGDGYDDDDAGGNKWEWCADHTKPIPVTLPNINVVEIGESYSGSPFLGALGSLPPGGLRLNQSGAYTFMWHSHAEREMTNNDVFPGGMMTMLIIEAPGVLIDELH